MEKLPTCFLEQMGSKWETRSSGFISKCLILFVSEWEANEEVDDSFSGSSKWGVAFANWDNDYVYGKP